MAGRKAQKLSTQMPVSNDTSAAPAKITRINHYQVKD
jgi:hypothetical protein